MTKKYADDLLLEYYSSRNIKIRNQIINANMALVVHVVNKMVYNCRIPKDDLIQIGSLGLIKAVEGFNPKRNILFSSYAVKFIHGEILHFIRDKSRMVKVPREIQELHQKIKNHSKKQGLTYEQSAIALEINLVDAMAAATACNEIIIDIPDIPNSINKESYSILVGLLQHLSCDEFNIIKSLYIDQLSITATSKLYKLRFKEIRKIEKQSIQKLQLIAQNRVKCPQCGNFNTIKNGKRGNKQSYLCKCCKFQFRENALPIGRPGYDDKIKFKAIKFMSEGKSSYWCETYLGMDNTTAYLWYKKSIEKINGNNNYDIYT